MKSLEVQWPQKFRSNLKFSFLELCVSIHAVDRYKTFPFVLHWLVILEVADSDYHNDTLEADDKFQRILNCQ